MSNKIRLDVAVFEGGYAPSREKAKAIIMAGQVYVNNQKLIKQALRLSVTISLRSAAQRSNMFPAAVLSLKSNAMLSDYP